MELTVEDLRKVSAISEVPEDQLEWLISRSSVLEVAAGEFLFKKGDSIERMFIFLEGEAALKMEQNGQFKTLGRITTNSISGFLPYSRATSSIGYGEALSDCRVVVVNKGDIREMATMHFELTEALVHVMTSRTREFARNNVQTEKMMALGKLSAGLAHELNNPASAITRSAKALKGHQIQGPEQFKRMLAITLDPSQIDTITQLLFQRIGYCEKWTMGLLERTEKEEELEQWLEGHGVGNGDELTETLLDFKIDTVLLDQIYLISGPRNFPVVIQWMENVLTTHQLVDEIGEAAQRIADLVQSVKTYTHMDQAQEREPTDIVKGIQSTLVMLDHKLKRKGILVDQQYNQQLPWPKIMIGEMNQVWTNLIDNAIDAMENGGKLTIVAERAGQSVQVRIMDNGKGIPEENLHSIFDPFFTTKPIGEGTGMGLEVVKRIIDQHRGEILVESEKGRTVFTVVLPLDK